VCVCVCVCASVCVCVCVCVCECVCASVCVSVCVCVHRSHIGGSVGDGAVDVGQGIQDIEGNKSDLVEPIPTLPPALGRLDHLSEDGGVAVDRVP